MNLKYFTTTLFISCWAIKTNAQTADSTKSKELQTITVEGKSLHDDIGRLSGITGTYIMEGKKSEVLKVSQLNASITDKTGRQIFAKVPGVFVYDMDGTGNQVNISTRGLDPHRGWEFNIRKDGVITNSDMYAYPASHYSVPMESVERIELVRGTGALQYGAQFGGMLNYVSKQASDHKAIELEAISTAGSYNLLSNYVSLGGTLKKWKYYTYFLQKSRDGYRDYEHTNMNAQGAVVQFAPNEKWNFRLEWARSSYLYRIPGPLTDAMFATDPTQATRSRNYFSPTINVPSFRATYRLSANTTVEFTSSAVIGTRNSVMFDKLATIQDTLNRATLQYANRQVDIDRFNSFTNELRVLSHYKIGQMESNLASGVQLMTNDLHRTQLGKGTTSEDYDLTLVDPVWGRDLHFATNNVAIYAENSFYVLKNLKVNAGARFEMGESRMSGTMTYYPGNKIPVSIKHQYPLLGASFSYKPSLLGEVYGGFSQMYRPMIFKDLVPSSIYEKVDQNIKDAKGYNLELGYRGRKGFLRWDVTGFLLRYDNRFGTLGITDETGIFITYRTNIGNSETKGLEIFIQGDWNLSKKSSLSIFTSTSLMEGKYVSGEVKTGNTNISVVGNKIESVPAVITRNGLTVNIGAISSTLLYSYTSETYADALNTRTPNASGAIGLVPSYGILDLNAAWRLSDMIQLKMNINNITNEHYFTKRPLFYPGPGIWPSDGRNMQLCLTIKI